MASLIPTALAPASSPLRSRERYGPPEGTYQGYYQKCRTKKKLLSSERELGRKYHEASRVESCVCLCSSDLLSCSVQCHGERFPFDSVLLPSTFHTQPAHFHHHVILWIDVRFLVFFLFFFFAKPHVMADCAIAFVTVPNSGTCSRSVRTTLGKFTSPGHWMRRASSLSVFPSVSFKNLDLEGIVLSIRFHHRCCASKRVPRSASSSAIVLPSSPECSPYPTYVQLQLLFSHFPHVTQQYCERSVLSCHELLIDDLLDVQRIHNFHHFVGERKFLFLHTAAQPEERLIKACISAVLFFARVVSISIRLQCSKTRATTRFFARYFPSRAIGEHILIERTFITSSWHLSKTANIHVHTCLHIIVVTDTVTTFPSNGVSCLSSSEVSSRLDLIVAMRPHLLWFVPL